MMKSGTTLKTPRQKLLGLRDRFRGLLQDWEPYLFVVDDIKLYVILLTGDTKIHETRSDVLVDLGILKDLVPKLEHELDEAKKERFNVRLSSIYAHRKRAMMLRELHNILGKENSKLPDDFRKWIKQLLLYTEWDDDLRFAREDQLMELANAVGVRLTKQTIKFEKFDADEPDLIEKQFVAHMEELGRVKRKTHEILCAYDGIPNMLESLKELVRSLEVDVRYLMMTAR